jgi:hypothetical protein
MFIVIVVSGTLESSSRLLWSALPFFFLFVAAQPIKGGASIRAGECGGQALPQEIPNLLIAHSLPKVRFDVPAAFLFSFSDPSKFGIWDRVCSKRRLLA